MNPSIRHDKINDKIEMHKRAGPLRLTIKLFTIHHIVLVLGYKFVFNLSVPHYQLKDGRNGGSPNRERVWTGWNMGNFCLRVDKITISVMFLVRGKQGDVSVRYSQFQREHGLLGLDTHHDELARVEPIIEDLAPENVLSRSYG